MTHPHPWRIRQVTPKPHADPPPPDTPREGPYAGRPTLRRLQDKSTTSRTPTWTLGWPGARLRLPTQRQSHLREDKPS